jgi:large subunit ribosomal protein L24
MRLKKGFEVVAIAGRDKGKTGKILKVLPKENRVIVAGINTVKKHTKPSKTHSGGIITKELSIHVSNIAFLDPKLKKPSKVAYKVLEDGKKVRVSKRSNEVIVEANA